MAQPLPHRSTVAIPLHASAPWVDRIEANIRSLVPVARVLVSDVSGRDGTLGQLRERVGDHPSVWWSSRTDVPPGWVAHCNALREQAETEYFMWLGHDDTVDPEWIAEGEKALDATPTAALAVGRLTSVREGKEPSTADPVADYAAPEPAERVAASLTRLFAGRQDGLGHAFRGLMRRELAPELPLIDEHGTKADMYWALTLLGRGSFVAIDAAYTKFWHQASASASWVPITVSPAFRHGLGAALQEFTPEMRERLFLSAWTEEALVLRETVDGLRERIQQQRRKIDSLSATRGDSPSIGTVMRAWRRRDQG